MAELPQVCFFVGPSLVFIPLLPPPIAFYFPGFLVFSEPVHYERLRKLTEGGMAEVWLCMAREPVLSQAAEGTYCVAKIPRGHIKNQDSLLRQEVSINYHLRKHPNIAKILGFSHNPATVLMKFYQLGSLDALIHQDRPNFQWSTRVRQALILDIARGIRHMHDTSIVHRDLKPANILLTYQGRRMAAMLADFGISQLLDGKENVASGFELRNVRGLSFTYASPGCIHRFLLREEGYPDELKSDDVYSMAVILYEMLTNRYPWRY